MTCWLKIKQLEKKLGRKLSEKEKKEIREKMGHIETSKSKDFDSDQKSEISDIEDNENNEKEEVLVVA